MKTAEEQKFKRVVKELLILAKVDIDTSVNYIWEYHNARVKAVLEEAEKKIQDAMINEDHIWDEGVNHGLSKAFRIISSLIPKEQ